MGQPLIVSSVAAEACVCDLTEPLGLSQPTVPHHLTVLVDAGFRTRDERGVGPRFALADGAMETVTASLPTAGRSVTS